MNKYNKTSRGGVNSPVKTNTYTQPSSFFKSLKVSIIVLSSLLTSSVVKAQESNIFGITGETSKAELVDACKSLKEKLNFSDDCDMLGKGELRELVKAKIAELDESKNADLFQEIKTTYNTATAYDDYANICDQLKTNFGKEEPKCQMVPDCEEPSINELRKHIDDCFAAKGVGKGAEVAGCQHDNIPLLQAVCAQDFPGVKKLFNGDDYVNVNTSNSKGETAGHLAVKMEHVGILNLLISYGINLSSIDEQGNTVVHIAAQTGNDEIFYALQRQGANMKKSNNSGHTPLFVAVQNNKFNIVKLLKGQSGMSSDGSEDENGNRIGQIAAKNKNWSMVQYLIHNDFVDDLSYRNDADQTIYDVAKENGAPSDLLNYIEEEQSW